MAAANLALVYLYGDRPAAAYEHSARALLALKTAGPDSLAWAHSIRAIAASTMGHFLEAKKSLRLSFELAEAGSLGRDVPEAVLAALAVLAISDVPLLAAKLWGATASGAFRASMHKSDRALGDRILLRVRRVTQPAAFEIASAEGGRIGIARALDEVEARLDRFGPGRGPSRPGTSPSWKGAAGRGPSASPYDVPREPPIRSELDTHTELREAFVGQQPIRESQLAGLSRWGFAEPGPLRDQLTAAALSGAKTTTSSLLAEFEVAGEPIPSPGRREVLVDSQERPVAIVETVEVRLVRLVDVDDQHARDEGEGYANAAQFRLAHEQYWGPSIARLAEGLGDPNYDLNDETVVVLERFRILSLLV